MTTADPKRLTFLQKLADIRGRLNLKFDALNPGFKKKGKDSPYVSLSGVLNALNPLLEEHELLLTQTPEVTPGGFVLHTRIQEIEPEVDEDGIPLCRVNSISAQWPLGIGKAQASASDSTYAARYSIVRLFAVTAEEDDDGNAASGVVVQASSGAANILSRL